MVTQRQEFSVSEIGLWVLKNSLARKPQKNDRVRMPYKRFSLLT
jgi:hypothetical protein